MNALAASSLGVKRAGIGGEAYAASAGSIPRARDWKEPRGRLSLQALPVLVRHWCGLSVSRDRRWRPPPAIRTAVWFISQSPPTQVHARAGAQSLNWALPRQEAGVQARRDHSENLRPLRSTGQTAHFPGAHQAAWAVPGGWRQAQRIDLTPWPGNWTRSGTTPPFLRGAIAGALGLGRSDQVDALRLTKQQHCWDNAHTPQGQQHLSGCQRAMLEDVVVRGSTRRARRAGLQALPAAGSPWRQAQDC